ncbi:MAG TPA: MFS transporter [Streptosporangiaceae bacterium]|jgi:MFS family permease
MLAVLLAAPFMAQADATIANVAGPSVRAGLHASGAELELVIGGYLVAFAMLVITGARLGHSYGYRRVFLAGIAGFTAASLACALAPSPVVLIAARVIQGGAAAMMFPQALTGIQLHYAGADRYRAIGRYAMALSAGAVTGQLAGGALIAANLAGSGWRAIFLINIPVGLAVLAAARWLPADGARRIRRLDLRGIAVLSGAALLLLLPLVLGQSQGWPAWTWACLAASLPAGAGFVLVERRVAARAGSPLVNVAVLARPPVTWALLTLVITTGTYLALLFTLAQYLQAGLGRSPVVSGVTLISWVAAFGLAGRLAGRLPERLRPGLPVAGCLLLATAFLAISGSLLAGWDGEPLLVVFLGGGGLGLVFGALTSHLTHAVPAGYAADISGVATTGGQIGGAVGVAAAGTLYLSQAQASGAATATRAFAVTTAALGTVALAALLTARAATRRRPGAAAEAPASGSDRTSETTGDLNR